MIIVIYTTMYLYKSLTIGCHHTSEVLKERSVIKRREWKREEREKKRERKEESVMERGEREGEKEESVIERRGRERRKREEDKCVLIILGLPFY